jgi:hypothetical protein
MEDLSELAQLARRAAELDIATDPEPLLQRFGLTPSAWLAMHEKLLAALADDLDRGETERANLFSATYEQRRAELLGAEQIANDNGAPPGSVAPPSGELAPDETAMVDSRAVARAAQTRAVPFDLSAPAIIVPPRKALTEEQSGATELTPALDLEAVLASRGIPLKPAAKVPPPAESPDATAEIDTRGLTAMLQERGVLPFDNAAPAAPPAPSPPQDQSGQTVLTPQLDLEALRKAKKP